MQGMFFVVVIGTFDIPQIYKTPEHCGINTTWKLG